MKSRCINLSVALLLLSTTAFAQSHDHKTDAVKTPATKSDAQKSFETMKSLAGDWQGPVKADLPVSSNADIAAGRVQGLGRPTFLGNQAIINVIQPGTVYGDRLNQIDFRATKIFNVGKGKLEANFDVYNLGNSDAILTQNNTFGGTWTRPTAVIQPRFVKFTAHYDF